MEFYNHEDKKGDDKMKGSDLWLILGLTVILTIAVSFSTATITGNVVSKTPNSLLPVKCTDSDNGNNIYVKGYVIDPADPNTKWTDTCTVGSGKKPVCVGDNLGFVHEYYCDAAGNKVKGTESYCKYGCKDGVCLKTGTTTMNNCELKQPSTSTSTTTTTSTSPLTRTNFKINCNYLGSEDFPQGNPGLSGNVYCAEKGYNLCLDAQFRYFTVTNAQYHLHLNCKDAVDKQDAEQIIAEIEATGLKVKDAGMGFNCCNLE